MNYKKLIKYILVLIAVFTASYLFSGFTMAVISIFLLLVFFGLPLYIVIFGIAITLLNSSENFTMAAVIIDFQKLESQDFIAAIPLFTFAGYLLSTSKSPERIVKLFQNIFSFIPGADAAVVIIIMALFTALTGASGISILALGGLMYPLLIKSGKSEKFSLGLITSSGSIGLLFAPSLPVIIYAIIASQSMQGSVDIEVLFKAALIPGIILVGALALFATLREKKNKKNTEIKATFSGKKLMTALREARWELPLPVIIYGGIYSGFFTVMDAALVVAIYTFIIEFFLYKDLNLKKDFVKNVADAMKLSGGIFIIMATAFVLTKYISLNHIPDQIINALAPYITTPFAFLLFVNVFLLITGCLLDIFSAILIVLPILIPIVEQYGINPYHFAIIFLVNLEIGYLTPPVGMNLFIASYRFKKRITVLYKATLPFLVLMVALLILFTYVPWFSTMTLKNQKSSIEKDITPPGAIKDLQIISITAETVTISFTAVGDDNLNGVVTGYRFAVNPEPNFMNDDFTFEDPLTIVPVKSGEKQVAVISNLFPGDISFISIMAYDENTNYGIKSPPLKVITPSE